MVNAVFEERGFGRHGILTELRGYGAKALDGRARRREREVAQNN